MSNVRIIRQNTPPQGKDIWVHRRDNNLVAEINEKGKWRDLINNNDVFLVTFEYAIDDDHPEGFIKSSHSFSDLETLVDKQHKYPVAVLIISDNSGSRTIGAFTFQGHPLDFSGEGTENYFVFSGGETYNQNKSGDGGTISKTIVYVRPRSINSVTVKYTVTQ